MSALDALLDGFDEAAHPRGYRGRWEPKAGDAAHYFHELLGGNVRVTVKSPPDKRGWMRVTLPNGDTRRVRAGVVSREPVAGFPDVTARLA